MKGRRNYRDLCLWRSVLCEFRVANLMGATRLSLLRAAVALRIFVSAGEQLVARGIFFEDHKLLQLSHPFLVDPRNLFFSDQPSSPQTALERMTTLVAALTWVSNASHDGSCWWFVGSTRICSWGAQEICPWRSGVWKNIKIGTDTIRRCQRWGTWIFKKWWRKVVLWEMIG